MTPNARSNRFPPLKNPDPRVADPGKVRLGDSAITGTFPPLKTPDPKIADPGIVRLGDSAITGSFARRR